MVTCIHARESSLWQPGIRTPLCTVKCCFYARYPGQTFWRSFGSTDKDAGVWWDTDLPFPSSTGMPLTVEWWMVAHACHTFAHAHIWHTYTCENIQATLLVRSTRLWHCITHTQRYTNTLTQRQTDVLTVALHYSEPGVGGKGNKVVFISCSLGVL